MADETLTQRQLWHKKYYQSNREKLIEYQLEYHNANREERLKYQRDYNKKYYQANRQRNRKAEKIEAMIPTDADASSLSSKQSKAEQQAQRAQQRAEKAQQKEEKAEASQSQWAIPLDAKPWVFLREEPKRQVHRPQQKKKPTFQFAKGEFLLAFD